MKSRHIQHLYWRVGFGILPNQLKSLSKMKKKDVVESLFKASKTNTLLEIYTSEIDAILNSDGDVSDMDKRRIQELSKKKRLDLNIAWIERLINPKELLREKMTLFWTNVFVCEDNNNIVYMNQFHNTLRTHALGSFRDFVKAISKEPAMTKYLNTKQNRKQKPNENFARELMELFTLGEGHYTEQDIKESARAFTGYSHNLKGEFVLRKFQHDNNHKTFFGETGNFTGDDIIDIILKQKQCAEFICEKVYRFFVNDNINPSHINEMVKVFYKDYNIERLMRHVFVSDWFYDEENIGVKIKSPIEFLIGMRTFIPVELQNKKQLVFLQRQLGQVLFDPPNVAGWKGGRSWIDSNTIALRLKLPSIMLNDAYISKVKKGENDFMEVKKLAFRKEYGKAIKSKTDWNAFEDRFSKVEFNDLPNYILACNVNKSTGDYLNTLYKVSKREYCIQLMSLPEYQMC